MILEAELVISSPKTAAWHRPLYHSGSLTPPKWKEIRPGATKELGTPCSGIARDDVGSGIARDDVGSGIARDDVGRGIARDPGVCPSPNCPPSGNLRPSHLGAGSAAWLPFPGQPGPDPDFGDAGGDTLHHFTIENAGHDVFRNQLLARNSFRESRSP